MRQTYSPYPKHILPNQYYFYRSAETLEIIPCKAIAQISVSRFKMMTTRREIFYAKKEEILEFQPGSRLFKHLMKQSKFRNCRDIMATVKAMRMDPNKVMVMDAFSVYDNDKEINDDEFIKAYLKFYKNDKYYSEYLDIAYKNVPGTASLKVSEFYRIVCRHGGMNNVINLQLWKKLFYDQMPKTNVSFALRNFYKKYLYQFELYRREFEDNEFEFNYIFKKGEHVIFKGSGAKFCGKVLARRNRGLNIYYINICNLKNNCSEWFAEDIISTAGNVCINNQLTFTKYMRIYYFLPDPITQEKNAHNLALIRNEKDKLQKISDSSEEKKDAIYNIYVLADLSTQLLENIRKKIKHSDSQDKENINN
ncbi:dead ringer [Tubulinosema ratisbonensis]|uniref:Dead ringer n=1 Tax=Tubulinosema ratisbonensis TaxID=291195 RepID=A0A437AJU4_9MICR|nr:dead ringer [Tubulinosema ratisbonensis]